MSPTTPPAEFVRVASALLEEGRLTAQVPALWLGGLAPLGAMVDAGYLAPRHARSKTACANPSRCRHHHYLYLTRAGFEALGDALWETFSRANATIGRYPPDVTRAEFDRAMLSECETGMPLGESYSKREHGKGYWDARRAPR